MELYSRMSEAWELARQCITRAQKHQKKLYDRGTKNPFRAGERVFLFKPAEQTGARRKFARPFHGPYRLLEVGTNTAQICPVDTPNSDPILVSLDRLRRCPEEIGDEFWPPRKTHKTTRQACGSQARPLQTQPHDLVKEQLDHHKQQRSQSGSRPPASKLREARTLAQTPVALRTRPLLRVLVKNYL